MTAIDEIPAAVRQILERAAERGRAAQLAYRGAVTPAEAWTLAQLGAARILDVRTGAEWELVGRVPGAEEIAFKLYPDWRPNPDFLAEVKRRFTADEHILLLCRSAQRSHHAAALLAADGYRNAYNILEGFEGDKNADGQRTANGWKVHGLPWRQ
ncbi:MAG: rhodanese-like domain-containing protein [Rhodocyclaceae bacterium]|nr:rhodanese-like domain-containing protein [Rhodocyclaceae bacterium]